VEKLATPLAVIDKFEPPFSWRTRHLPVNALTATCIDSSATVTLRDVLLEVPFSVAEREAVPAERAVAKPVEDTLAMADAEEFHVAEFVTSFVDASLYFAVALSCCVCPTGMLSVAGVTVTDVKVVGVEPFDNFNAPLPPHPVKLPRRHVISTSARMTAEWCRFSV
jgi:hypothetical protein